MFLWNHWWSDC